MFQSQPNELMNLMQQDNLFDIPCTDGKDDGKLSFGETLKSLGKGVVKTFTNAFSSPKNIAKTVATACKTNVATNIANFKSSLTKSTSTELAIKYEPKTKSNEISSEMKKAYREAVKKLHSDEQVNKDCLDSNKETLIRALTGAKGHDEKELKAFLNAHPELA